MELTQISFTQHANKAFSAVLAPSEVVDGSYYLFGKPILPKILLPNDTAYQREKTTTLIHHQIGNLKVYIPYNDTLKVMYCSVTAKRNSSVYVIP